MAINSSFANNWGIMFYLIYLILSLMLSVLLRITSIVSFLETRWNLKQRLCLYAIDKPKIIDLWMHGASAGEIKMCLYISKVLLKHDIKIHLSCQTKTAYELIQSSEQSKAVNLSFSFAPIDSPIVLKRFFMQYSIKNLWLYELELWPNLFRMCEKENIETKIISAKMTPKAYSSYIKYFKPFKLCKNNPITEIYCQTLRDAERFKEVFKSSNPSPKIQTTGDWKILTFTKNRVGSSKKIKHRKYDLAMISVHQEEWSSLLKFYETLLEKTSTAKLIIVPRYLNELENFKKHLQQSKYRWQENKTLESSSTEQITLISSFGLVSEILSDSKLALIGGSFAPDIGVHDFREVLKTKTPLIVGPFYELHQEIIEYYADLNLLKICITTENLDLCNLDLNLESIDTVFEEERDGVEGVLSKLLTYIVGKSSTIA